MHSETRVIVPSNSENREIYALATHETVILRPADSARQTKTRTTRSHSIELSPTCCNKLPHRLDEFSILKLCHVFALIDLFWVSLYVKLSKIETSHHQMGVSMLRSALIPAGIHSNATNEARSDADFKALLNRKIKKQNTTECAKRKRKHKIIKFLLS